MPPTNPVTGLGLEKVHKLILYGLGLFFIIDLLADIYLLQNSPFPSYFQYGQFILAGGLISLLVQGFIFTGVFFKFRLAYIAAAIYNGLLAYTNLISLLTSQIKFVTFLTALIPGLLNLALLGIVIWFLYNSRQLNTTFQVKGEQKSPLLRRLNPYLYSYFIFFILEILAQHISFDSKTISTFSSVSSLTGLFLSPLFFTIPVGLVINGIKKTITTVSVESDSTLTSKQSTSTAHWARILLYITGIISVLGSLFFLAVLVMGTLFFDDPYASYLAFVIYIGWAPFVLLVGFFGGLILYRRNYPKASLVLSILSIFFLISIVRYLGRW